MTRKHKNTFVGALAGLAFAAGISQAATIIYQDDFSGGTGNLAGEAPDVRLGSETWIALSGGGASGAFRANGTSITGGSGGSFLQFAPSAGNVYKLSASIDVTVSSANWISIGFSNGTSGNDFIVDANGAAVVTGGGGDDNDVFTFLGDGVSSQAAFDLNNDGLSEIDIILDATDADAANWTMEFIVGGSSIRGPLTKASGSGDGSWADISHVGISHNDVAGIVESFELSIIPEPASALLGSLGILGLLRRRR